MSSNSIRYAGWLTGMVMLALVQLATTLPAEAQYFGRNKVQYDDFDFSVFKTEHFEIYFYGEEQVAVQDAARMAERWYERHSQTFLREFRKRKPIIFYANDADFQQTNAISGTLGQGTGGVTESLKERVIMPLTGLYSETDHVLGHELVHSYQYDIGLSKEDSVQFAFQLLPLWLVEGTAEYLSVGRNDSHTAMWLRDAALRDDLPTIDDLTNSYRYFPYRYARPTWLTWAVSTVTRRSQTSLNSAVASDSTPRLCTLSASSQTRCQLNGLHQSRRTTCR